MGKERKRCKKCENKISGFLGIREDSKMEGYCIHCASDIQYEKEVKRRNSLSPNERRIEGEIVELEGGSGAVLVLVILGFIGLLFFLLPGIIFFIIAAIVSSSRKSKAASLRAQLESLKYSKKKSKSSTIDKVDPLTILKRKFAEGEITEEEYLEKKNILEGG